MERLCDLTELPRGGRLFLDALGGSRDLLVFPLGDGEVAVYDAHCPHAGALLRPENVSGGRLVCFLHMWEFEVATGACAAAPELPLRAVPHELRDGALWVDLREIPVRGRSRRPERLLPDGLGAAPIRIRLRSPDDKGH
jgi:nitrite reductase/ring-hydroxylating ferredoxin subunit